MKLILNNKKEIKNIFFDMSKMYARVPKRYHRQIYLSYL